MAWGLKQVAVDVKALIAHYRSVKDSPRKTFHFDVNTI